MAGLQVPLKVVTEIIDLVAAHYPHSLPSCALVSRSWNLRSAHHLRLENVLRVCVTIARLPIELLHQIIDLVAKHNPGSSPTCALVPHQSNLRSTLHLQRLKKTFRHVRITSIPELHENFDIVEGNARVGQWPTPLEVSPDPAASTSYISFLHLSSCILPNVHRLVWGEGLRWTHYPSLYNNGAVGSSFRAVVALGLHCRFESARDLFRAIHSFKNIEEVRLLHPMPFPSSIPPIQAVPHLDTDISTRSGARLWKSLLSLYISVSHDRICVTTCINLKHFCASQLSVVWNVLEIFGDCIVNLSIRCPPASTLSSTSDCRLHHVQFE